MKGSLKIGICVGLSCIMVLAMQTPIRGYIGAVGLTRTKEQIIYPVKPLEGGYIHYNKETSTFVERIGKRVRAALYASAREVYESGRIGEASASDRGSIIGADEYTGEGAVLSETESGDDGADLEVAEDDSWEEVGSVYLGQFTATAYCACQECCGEYSSGYTASGTLATEGRTIACNSLPFGTEVMIDGNIYVVEDTGWSPYGDAWLDIFFADHDSALAYGMRTVDVYLIG